MCMHCYMFLSDESLLMYLHNNELYLYIYTNNILTQLIIIYSSLADITPGFQMIDINLLWIMLRAQASL